MWLLNQAPTYWKSQRPLPVVGVLTSYGTYLHSGSFGDGIFPWLAKSSLVDIAEEAEAEALVIHAEETGIEMPLKVCCWCSRADIARGTGISAAAGKGSGGGGLFTGVGAGGGGDWLSGVPSVGWACWAGMESTKQKSEYKIYYLFQYFDRLRSIFCLCVFWWLYNRAV